MNNISPELTTLCVIALGVGLLIFFAAFILIRLMKGSIFGLGMMVMRMISEPKDEETKIDPSSIPHYTANDLRAQAQSVDFDAAVAKHRQQGAQSQAAPPGTMFPNAPSTQPPPPQIQGFPPPKPPRQDDGTTR